MKVISGTLKGRNLFFLKNKDLRPTRDIVRESIFDVLRDSLSGERVLDLFAGTGALGIEAVSQGAKEAVFVESDYEAVRLIRKNIENLEIAGFCSIIKSSAEKAVETLKDSGFGLIIADPPYGYAEKKLSVLLEKIAGLGVVRKDGIVVVEREKKGSVFAAEGLTLYKERKYGRSVVSYLRA